MSTISPTKKAAVATGLVTFATVAGYALSKCEKAKTATGLALGQLAKTSQAASKHMDVRTISSLAGNKNFLIFSAAAIATAILVVILLKAFAKGPQPTKQETSSENIEETNNSFDLQYYINNFSQALLVNDNGSRKFDFS